MQKAIIFANTTDAENKEESLRVQLDKLRIYADKNQFEVVKEFCAPDDKNIGECPTFLKILEFIDEQDSKIHVIKYVGYTVMRGSIDDKFRELLKQKKIEIETYCHPCFKEPSNDHVKIWRYLTLPKFIEFLQSESLYFARADSLRSGDSSESSYLTDASLGFIKQINELDAKQVSIPHPEVPNLTINEMVKMDIRSNGYNEDYSLKKNFINCWHINDFENFAMWKVYSEEFGVCIQSTFGDLYKSFTDDKWSFYNKRKKIYIGEVNYIDWEKEFIPKDNAFWPFIHKRREFSYEQELRCIIGADEHSEIKVKVDTDILVNNIYINPFTPLWFKDVVTNLCRQNKMSPSKVIQSKLT